MYFLDTNVIIAVMNARPVHAGDRLKSVLRKGIRVSTSTIVAFELWYGVAASRQVGANRRSLERMFDGRIEVHAFEAEDAAIAGRLRAELKALGTPIGPYDLLIAAQALRLRATLVTANTGEFSRIGNLPLVDWTIDPLPSESLP